ncbi:hypothetical protein [Echinicola salinicaeni]|uniref:hypothetical protein n=1 Tax=Echinicola salinicaeni TaxID=2762757 RepID=UPI001648801D|nr:hypothetical protein [Echinicola salinicaeni]
MKRRETTVWSVFAGKGIFLFCMLTLAFSCSHQDKPELEWALNVAGENRAELEKVLNHYSENEKDSLKYKAAEFMISSVLPFQFIYEVPHTTELKELENEIEVMLSNYRGKESDGNKEERKQLLDSAMEGLQRKYGVLSSFRSIPKRELESVNSSIIIENIDYAFKAWEFPWARKYSFEDFCHYILPNIAGRFESKGSRKFFYDKFKHFADTLSNNEDPVEVCRSLNLYLRKQGFIGNKAFYYYPHFLTGKFMYECKITSNCVSVSNLVLDAMRSIGLPVAEVYWNKYGNTGLDHISNTILCPDGTWKYFNGVSEYAPKKEIDIGDKVTKLYRTSHVKPEDLNEKVFIAKSQMNVLGWQDITEEVTKSTFDISLDIKDEMDNADNIVFLCVFRATGRNNWLPVDWSRIKDGKVVFENINGKEVVYLAMEDKGNGIMTAVSQPFVLEKDGSLQFIKAKDKRVSVSLKRKFPPKQHLIEAAEFLKGSQFQASNTPDFRNPQTLYTISNLENLDGEVIELDKDQYRYYRLKYPKLQEDIKYDLAELAFYESTGEGEKKVKGEYIYSAGVNDEFMDALFDEDFLSFTLVRRKSDTTKYYTYYSDYKKFISDEDQVWYGLDFRKPKAISKIHYVPRTDMNGVYPNMDYELLFWNDRWESLGMKQVEDGKLIYDNIPEGALLWLRNHTEGKEERIFTIEDGEQIWW